MSDLTVSRGRGFLIAVGVVLVVAAVAYAIVHNTEKTNNNPHACINRTFSLGASGKCISDGQNLLNWYLYGIDEPNYMKITGTFSETTETAVKKTQSGASLGVNGKLDPETWKLICGGSDTPSWWNTAAKNAGCT